MSNNSNTNTTKATFYLDKDIYHAFRVKAAVADKKISDLMNETLRSQIIEDKEDVKVLRSRSKDASETYAQFLAELQTDGYI